jgi:hypothetical protein
MLPYIPLEEVKSFVKSLNYLRIAERQKIDEEKAAKELQK